MSSDEPFTITIEGGSPWGFSIQGGLDFRSPLKVKTVKAGGRASQSGLVAGDYILEINGQETKNLKHMEAQQLIKKSTNVVKLKCVKLRPGLTSPAVGMSPSFTFPTVSHGNQKPVAKSPVTKIKPIARPPPPAVAVNGHVRKSSTSDTTSSSPHNADCYDAKYAGMDSFCIDKSHPIEQGQIAVQVQEPVEAVEMSGDSPVVYDFQTEGEGPKEVTEEVGVTEMEQEASIVYDFQPDANESEQQGETPIVQEEEVSCNQYDEGKTPISESVAAVEMEHAQYEMPVVQGEIPQPEGELPVVETTEAVVLQDSQYEISISDEQGNPPDEAPPINDEDWEIVDMPASDDSQNPTNQIADSRGTETQNPTNQIADDSVKSDLVNILAAAAKERKRRESSTDSEDPTKGQSSPQKSPQVSPPKQSPPTKPVTTATKPPKPVRATAIETKETVLPVAKQPLRKTENPVAMGTKDPGWYKSMFQDFQNTVEECFPGAKSSEEAYVYDDRGLKVRRDSLPRVSDQEEETAPKRETAPSPDDPVYVYDDRGLRVRADSLGKVQRSLSPEVEAIKKEQRPKSATTAKISATPGAVSTDDILSANKKQTTGYKSAKYSTEGSRDYWKQKDQDHQEFEIKRRNSQEKLHHVRQGSSEFSSKMSTMHPLLQSGLEEGGQSKSAEDVEPSEGVLTRIDASKLHGALENASMLGKLEKEGVSTDLLPAVAMETEKSKAKEKQLKPPPGRKGKALFNFDGQSSKELSFKKGDILDLIHTIDDNWLEGSLQGAKGIFPVAYIKVLTLDEYRAMMSPELRQSSDVGKALALYDFQGQTEKEISFSKDDVLSIVKKIDDNWFQGYHGDKKGIFPSNYVQVVEGSYQ